LRCNEFFGSLKHLVNREGIDITMPDKDGKTTIMNIISKRSDEEICYFGLVTRLLNEYILNCISDHGDSLVYKAFVLKE